MLTPNEFVERSNIQWSELRSPHNSLDKFMQAEISGYAHTKQDRKLEVTSGLYIAFSFGDTINEEVILERKKLAKECLIEHLSKQRTGLPNYHGYFKIVGYDLK